MPFRVGKDSLVFIFISHLICQVTYWCSVVFCLFNVGVADVDRNTFSNSFKTLHSNSLHSDFCLSLNPKSKVEDLLCAWGSGNTET